MAKNHDIRIKLSLDDINNSRRIQKEIAPGLKLMAWDRMVYKLGISSLGKDAIDKNPQLLIQLMGAKK